MSNTQGMGAPRRVSGRISRAIGLALLSGLPLAAGAAAPLHLLSYGAADILGGQANRASQGDRHSVSADGRYVVFATASNNLVGNDSGGYGDVYLADRQDGKLTRISRRADGGEPNGHSSEAAISADGRWIAYVSQATDIVDAEAQPRSVFLFDRDSGLTRLLTPRVASAGTDPYARIEGLALSGNGGVVVFAASSRLLAQDDDDFDDVYAWTSGGGLQLVSTGNAGEPLAGSAHAASTSVSADGRFVGFSMMRVSIVPEEGGIFVRDLAATTTTAVQSGAERVQGFLGTSLSADGRFLAFSTGQPLLPVDDNSDSDIYVLDRSSGAFELVSVGSAGQISDLASESPAISADGRHVAFISSSTRFHPVAKGREIYLRDRSSGTTRLLSSPVNGQYPPERTSAFALPPSISADGQLVVFASYAEDLVVGDSNRRVDVFAARSDASALTRVSQSADTPRIAGLSGVYMRWSPLRAYPAGDSGTAVFASAADNLTAQRGPGLFWHDIGQAATGSILLDPLPTYPHAVELHVDGVAADGKILLRRRPYDFTHGWGGPTANEPYDLWLLQGPSYVRVDASPVLGGGATTRGAQLSDDGRYVLFNSQRMSQTIPFSVEPRLFLFDSSDSSLRRVDTNSAGVPVDAPLLPRWGMSRNGRYLAFITRANNLAPGDTDSSADLYLRDLQDGSLVRLRHPQSGVPLASNDMSNAQRIAVSDDGSLIAVPDKVDGGDSYTFGLFVLDRAAQTVTDLCAGSVDPIRACIEPSMSADGSALVFAAGVALLPQDSNGKSDIYRYTRASGELSLESVDEQGRGGNGDSSWPQLSGSGDVLVFRTESNNWITHPRAAGEGDFVLKRKPGDAVFADAFQASR